MKIPVVAPTLFTHRESASFALKNGTFGRGKAGFQKPVWCEQILLGSDLEFTGLLHTLEFRHSEPCRRRYQGVLEDPPGLE